jgi:uncharacterized repeat protein (TIGR01451 family)
MPRALRASWRLGFAFKKALVALLAITASALTIPTHADTPPGTVISNVGYVEFTNTGVTTSDTVASNAVSATVVPLPSTSSISILRFTDSDAATQTTTAGPTQCLSNGSYANLAAPRFSNGATVDASQVLALAQTQITHDGDAVFVQVSDADQNRDATKIDTLDVIISSAAGDQETVQLSETGLNTGKFVGYVQTRDSGATARGDCILQADRNSTLTTTYTDRYNSSDVSTATALIDPYGTVFDSVTGQAVNGVIVRLLNATTGALASVVGDDGVSKYPAEMTTGKAVTDAGGTTYNLPAGVYRFPLVAPGQYRFEVTPPSGYTFASGRSMSDLKQLNTASQRLSSASYGAAFTTTATEAVAIDLPVDPSGTQLFLSKSTTTTIAVPGDFVQYTLTLQNASNTMPVSTVIVTDVLPQGLRYQPGSTKLGTQKLADPTISKDGRTLSFAIGTLAAAASINLTYVVEVTVAAHEDKLTNSARAANAAGAASNTAQATIRLRNELFNETAFIMGRIVAGECTADSTQLEGVEGVRVYLEDGRYAVTDPEGKYHFEGVAPGSHVVQIDTVTVPDTLELQQCDEQVRNAGRSYSQFVELRAGALWRADFLLKHKGPPQGVMNFGMTTKSVGDVELSHTLLLQAATVPLSNAKLMVTVPDGIDYVAGSARLGGQVVSDPQNIDGTLIFRIGAVAADTPQTLTFNTRVKDQAAGGFVIKSMLLFDTAAQKSQRSTNLENRVARGDMNYESASYRFSPHFAVMGIELSAADRAQLDKLAIEWRGVKNLRIRAVGHTDKQAIPKAKQALFADNYALSKARAQAVTDYLRAALELGDSQIEISGKGADEPLASGDDAFSLATNRRVEIEIEGLRVKQLGKVSVLQARAEAPPVATEGLLISTAASKPAISGGAIARSAIASDRKPLNRAQAAADVAPITRGYGAPDIDVETLDGGVAMLRPAENEVPAIPSIKIAIQHAPDQNVELRLNGAPVSALNFDGVLSKQDKSLSLSRWRGVDLKDGDNELLAIVRNTKGEEVDRITRVIHYSGGAVRAELMPEHSVLSANGNTRPLIALRMFDAAGEVARPGTVGSFSIETPYRSWLEAQALQDKQLQALTPRDPQFVVDADGIAHIELETTSQSGMAVIHLRFNERQSQDVRVWLAPQARDWILVGLAEGTAGYNLISKNAEAAASDDVEEGYTQDGRVAFFAKGRIKGDFLLTLAYDSNRQASDKQTLLGTIDPHRYYTLYGDGSEQRFEAASSRKLYIKLERRQFMAMFGDFTAGLTVTELSRYSRTLTGVKSEYAGERFGYTAFAANTDQGYVQDELQGDGTSGLYKLSQQDIIANSDQLRVEVRDRIRTEVVVETRTLTRYIDYDIDYLNGTLYFKQPVMSRDANFNPQFIVVDYEVDSGMKDAVSAGGRGYMKLGSAELGASFINEGAAAGDTRLGGIDARIKLADSTHLRAEVARTESANPTHIAESNAWFTEIKHVSKQVDARAYFRVQENGFGFGQQLSTETGSRKAGMDARIKLDDQWAIKGEVLDQDLMATHAERQLGSVELNRATQLTTAGAGLRYVGDRNVSIGDVQSEQGFLNGSIKLFDQRVTLRAEQDVSLSGASAVSDFPDRSLLGVDYLVTKATTLFADYEHATGATLDADMTRIGVRTSPWQRAQVSSSMSQQFTENGARTFANLGLTQGWQVTERWAMDFGMDQSRTVHSSNDYTFNQNAPPASGTASNGTATQWQTGDYLALSVASVYRAELWSISDRVEHRHGDSEDRWSLLSGFYREAVKGHAFAFVTQYLNSNNKTSGDAVTAALQLSWAYRPTDSRWIVLDRIDLKHQRSDSTAQTMQSSRVVNNTHANWLVNNRTQVGLQFGMRYVITTFSGDRYAGASGLLGADYRQDLNKTFDIGVHGSALESFKSGVSNASLGADVGITFMKNVWVSVGYNVQGYNDKDFDDSHYLAQGPYLKFRVKFDQDTFKDLNLAALRGKGN